MRNSETLGYGLGKPLGGGGKGADCPIKVKRNAVQAHKTGQLCLAADGVGTIDAAVQSGHCHMTVHSIHYCKELKETLANNLGVPAIMGAMACDGAMPIFHCSIQDATTIVASACMPLTCKPTSQRRCS